MTLKNLCPITRRGLIASGGALLGITALRAGTALATPLGSVNVLNFGADRSGRQDSSPAFNRAVVSLAPFGGDVYVPAGNYLLSSPLIYNANFSIGFYGDGSGMSYLYPVHTGWAMTFVPVNQRNQVRLGGLSVAAPTIGANGGIKILMPNVSISEFSSCDVSDIAFFGNFQTGLDLANVWSSRTSNLKMTGPSAGSSSTFINLGGFSIDNTFDRPNCSQVGMGFSVSGYCEGIHLNDPIFGNVGVGIDTGASCLGCGTGHGTINVNGFYITEGEISCVNSAANLSYVLGGYIKGTHFGTTGGGGPTINAAGCTGVQLSDASISGAGLSSSVGILLQSAQGSSGNVVSVYNTIDGCRFPNIDPGTAVVFGPGALSNNALNVRMNNQEQYGLLMQDPNRIVSDRSGNSTNVVTWVTSSGIQTYAAARI